MTSHQEGMVYFAPITFTQTGNYLFTLQEAKGDASNYTYDTTRWTLEIEVGKEGDDLKILHAVYRADGKPDADKATFVNGYYPPDQPPETPDEGGEENKNPLHWIYTLLPQTGDSSQPMLWVALLVIPAGCLAAIVVWRKRKK